MHQVKATQKPRRYIDLRPIVSSPHRRSMVKYCPSWLLSSPEFIPRQHPFFSWTVTASTNILQLRFSQIKGSLKKEGTCQICHVTDFHRCVSSLLWVKLYFRGTGRKSRIKNWIQAEVYKAAQNRRPWNELAGICGTRSPTCFRVGGGCLIVS
jgi:hypothetical protein